jgi:hypothetical protein
MSVAKEGLLREGGKPVGWAETVRSNTGCLAGWVPIRVRIEGNEGELTVYEPFEDQFRIEARAVSTPHKRHWLIECHGRYVTEETGRYVLRSCGRFVRLLVRPNMDRVENVFAPWACTRCWHVRYLDRGADGHLARAHRSLNRSLELAAVALQWVDSERKTISMMRQVRAMRKQEAAERAWFRAQGWTFADETQTSVSGHG